MATRLIELVTRRLVLRQWHEEDRAPSAAINADPSVMEHLPALLTRDQSDELIDRFIERMKRDGYGLWAVELRVSGELIGFVGLAVPTWKAAFTTCTEIGWRLARSAWGTDTPPRPQRQHWQQLSAPSGWAKWCPSRRPATYGPSR